MKIRTISYTDIDYSFLHKLYELNNLLFPDLIISKPNKKGIISIREKGFFLKRRIRKHIQSFLFTDLTAALTFYKFGSKNMIRFYRQKIEQELAFDTGEISTISRVINLLHTECFNTVSTKEKLSILKPQLQIIHKVTEIKEQKEEPVTIEQIIPNLLDFIFPRVETKLKRVKSTLIAASIALILFAKTPLQWGLVETGNGILYNLSSREPPITELLIYNST